MKAKRFFSVLLAIMMLVSCFAISASAATNAAVKPNGPYNLYIGLYAANKSDDVDLDANVTGKQNAAAVSGKTAIKNYFFAIYQVENTVTNAAGYDLTGKTPVSVVTTGTTGTATFTTSTAGRYLVVPATNGKYFEGETNEVSVTQPTTVNGTPVKFLVDLPMTDPTDRDSWMTDVYVYPKVVIDTDKPKVTKSVSNDATNFGQSATIASVDNGVATWKITIKDLPASINNYSALSITDVVDSRLSVVDEDAVAATFGTETLTKTTHYTAVWSNIADGDGAKKLVVTFTSAGIKKLSSGKNIEITYQTSIDTYEAGAVGYQIGNHVVLSYTDFTGTDGKTDNTPENPKDDTFDPGDPYTWDTIDVPNPNYDPEHPDGPDKPETVEVKVPSTPGDDETDGTEDPYIYTGKLTIIKTDNSTPATKLNGAQFTIYKTEADAKAGTNGYKTLTDANRVADGEGEYVITGLASGTYYVVETKAPSGYNLDGSIKTVVIGGNGATFGSTSNQIKDITFVDIPKTDLPLTGGMGVGMFAVLGLALAAFGGVYLFKTRKVGAC